MDYYGPSTSHPAGTATLPARPVYTVAAPAPMTPSRLLTWTLGQLLLGVLTFLVGVVGSIIVAFAFGTYNGSEVTAADVRSAQHGQPRPPRSHAVGERPVAGHASRRRPMWQLQVLIGVVVAFVPLSILAQHLSVTDWRAAFV